MALFCSGHQQQKVAFFFSHDDVSNLTVDDSLANKENVYMVAFLKKKSIKLLNFNISKTKWYIRWITEVMWSNHSRGQVAGPGVLISEVPPSKKKNLNNAARKTHNTGRKCYMVGVLPKYLFASFNAFQMKALCRRCHVSLSSFYSTPTL